MDLDESAAIWKILVFVLAAAFLRTGRLFGARSFQWEKALNGGQTVRVGYSSVEYVRSALLYSYDSHAKNVQRKSWEDNDS